MKLRLTLVLLCLLGIGIFSHAQNKKKTSKPTIVNSPDEIPVTMISSKKHHKPPPPPPPLDKYGKPLPPPKVEVVHFKPPVIVKDEKTAPPPPKIEKTRFAPPKIVKDAPKHTSKEKPVKPDAPPVADFRG